MNRSFRALCGGRAVPAFRARVDRATLGIPSTIVSSASLQSGLTNASIDSSARKVNADLCAAQITCAAVIEGSAGADGTTTCGRAQPRSLSC
jgi:hypothetical protein